MRAFIILANIAVVAVAWNMSSLTGMLLVTALSFVFIALSFALFTARTESRESRDMQRAMGRNSTFLAGLRDR